MALDQIDNFMRAISRLESGSAEGNYAAQGPTVTSGMYAGERAQGRFQIMPGNWAGWSKAAGLAGADIRDPKAQDAVARHIMSGYYNQFGSWDLVAVAWFAGPGAARKAAQRGVGALKGTADVTGTNVPTYVSRIREYMGTGPSDSTESAALRRVDEGQVAPVPAPEPEVSDARAVAKQTVQMLSTMVQRNPGTGAHDAINRAMKLEV